MTEDKQVKNSRNKLGPTHPHSPSQYRRFQGRPSVSLWPAVRQLASYSCLFLIPTFTLRGSRIGASCWWLPNQTVPWAVRNWFYLLFSYFSILLLSPFHNFLINKPSLSFFPNRTAFQTFPKTLLPTNLEHTVCRNWAAELCQVRIPREAKYLRTSPWRWESDPSYK